MGRVMHDRDYEDYQNMGIPFNKILRFVATVECNGKRREEETFGTDVNDATDNLSLTDDETIADIVPE